MTMEQMLRDLHDMAQHTAVAPSKPVAKKSHKHKK